MDRFNNISFIFAQHRFSKQQPLNLEIGDDIKIVDQGNEADGT